MKTYLMIFILVLTLNSFGQSKDSFHLITQNGLNNQLVEINEKIGLINKSLKENERTHFEKYGALYVGFIALIGALFTSYRQYLATKRQAIANFRMNWIEQFRELCSGLQVSLDNIAFKAMDGKLKNVKKSHFAEDKDFIIARTAYHKLRLMINTSKNENKDYLELINQYIDGHIRYYNEEKDAPTFDQLKILKQNYLSQSELKLNSAWQKASSMS